MCPRDHAGLGQWRRSARRAAVRAVGGRTPRRNATPEDQRPLRWMVRARYGCESISRSGPNPLAPRFDLEDEVATLARALAEREAVTDLPTGWLLTLASSEAVPARIRGSATVLLAKRDHTNTIALARGLLTTPVAIEAAARALEIVGTDAAWRTIRHLLASEDSAARRIVLRFGVQRRDPEALAVLEERGDDAPFGPVAAPPSVVRDHAGWALCHALLDSDLADALAERLMAMDATVRCAVLAEATAEPERCTALPTNLRGRQYLSRSCDRRLAETVRNVDSSVAGEPGMCSLYR